MLILPKLIYRFNPNQNPSRIFVLGINKMILKFIQEGRGITIVKIILKKKNKVGRLTQCDFKTHYKPTVVRTVWYW